LDWSARAGTGGSRNRIRVRGRSEVDFVQDRSRRLVDLFQLVLQLLLLQGLGNLVLHLADWDLARRYDLVNVESRLISIDRRNLSRLQLEHRFLVDRQAPRLARSQAHFLDVTHPEANKGFVAGYFSRLLAMPEEEIATIGDGENDVLMFKRSGFSIAMGNASEEVRRQASVVTDSNDDEGFAKAVERFLLKTAD